MTVIPSGYIRAMLGPREEVLDSVLKDSLLGHGLRPMHIDDNAARVLQLLTLIRRPSRVIEIGTFFGYSAIHIARGLPAGGRLVTLEADPELAGSAHHMRRIGAGDQCLSGDAAGVDAGAAKRSAFDGRDSHARCRQAPRERRSGLPGADDDGIVGGCRSVRFCHACPLNTFGHRTTEILA